MTLAPEGWELALLPTIAALPECWPELDLALVDMPIGLPEQGPRRCDSEARARLGPRRSSVFPVPCRAAVQAPDYVTANRLNRQRLGRGVARQSWNICRRIAELDRFVLECPPFLLREAHPELAFASLAGAPLAHSKRTGAGKSERRELLSRRFPEALALVGEALGRYRRAQLAEDDILDALVLALAARTPLRSLPTMPEVDGYGLPMEIVVPGWRA